MVGLCHLIAQLLGSHQIVDSGTYTALTSETVDTCHNIFHNSNRILLYRQPYVVSFFVVIMEYLGIFQSLP